MKGRQQIWLAALALGPASAQELAWQWPLDLPTAGEPAYEVILDASVYQAITDPLLRDVFVLDAAGQALPAAMQAPPAAPRGAPRQEPVPWFLLPADASGPALPGAADGRFESAGVRLSWRLPEAADAGMPELLLDLGARPQEVRAVLIEAAGDAPMWRARLEVLDSPDLQRWTQAAAPTSLYRLSQDGHQLSLLRIELARAPARYLRLRHAADSARGAVSAVSVERLEQPAVEREPLRWLRLEGQALEGGWLFRSPGPMRVEAWNLHLGEGNWLVRAVLSSRADAKAGWQRRDESERYQWQVDGERLASAPARLQGVRDSDWRLELAEPRSAAPVLLLGYRPDRLLFLAEVDPPYRLAAGSADLRRTDAPTAAVLAAVRRQRGQDWQPVALRPGARQSLAGEAALVPARRPLDWRSYLLWTVLVAVAGSVVVIALKLLRQPEGGN